MRSHWLPSCVAVCLALLLCSPARAARLYEVTLDVQYNGAGSEGALTVDNSRGFTSLGAIFLITTGATGFSPNLANPGISAADSGLNLDLNLDVSAPPYGLLFVVNTTNGVAIAPLGAATLLGTLQFGDSPFSMIPAESDLFGDTTFYDVNSQPLVPYSVTSATGPVCGEPPCPPVLPTHYFLNFAFLVPEPGGIAGMTAVALALLALRRRRLAAR